MVPLKMDGAGAQASQWEQPDRSDGIRGCPGEHVVEEALQALDALIHDPCRLVEPALLKIKIRLNCLIESSA